MYTLVRRYVKTAVAFLAIGLAIGGWLIARRELAGAAPDPYLVSAHTHALFVGVGGEVLRSSLFGLNMSALWLRVAIVAAGFLQGIAIGVFFFTMWSRIRPVGSQAREAKGERF